MTTSKESSNQEDKAGSSTAQADLALTIERKRLRALVEGQYGSCASVSHG